MLKKLKIFFKRVRQVVTLLNVGHKILMSLTQILKEKGVMMGYNRNNDVLGESGRRRCENGVGGEGGRRRCNCECFERCLIEFLEDLLDALEEDTDDHDHHRCHR
ncbi:MAG: hypothetical protein K0Q97_2681 [Bacillota bacterium]|jgi:hypothetical protein|nr:hypothetical protein [Bacillota bacterium]